MVADVSAVRSREVPRVSVAPMMDYTDRHFRFMLRQISRRAHLYTEMVVAQAVRHGDRHKLLAFDSCEHPVVMQLGGDDPELLAEAAHICEEYGYDEINLNVGCPSPRVQSGNFGACLMRTPDLVAECVSAMRNAVRVPVTVKHRIGVDELDAYEDMVRFVQTVSSAGCTRFVVHARKALLAGLSPKQNRTVPPLRYAEVYRLKQDFPHLAIEINGGITDLDQTAEHLQHVDGVMIGRGAIHDPWLFHDVDQRFFGEVPPTDSREAVVERVAAYVDQYAAVLGKPSRAARHLLDLFAGQPGSRAYRRILTVEGSRDGGDGTVVRAALTALRAERNRRGGHDAAGDHGT